MNYREKIESKGLKLTWIAKQIGVSQSLMSLFLQGKRTLSNEKKKALDKLLKL